MATSTGKKPAPAAWWFRTTTGGLVVSINIAHNICRIKR
jgi:hypothetical protein